MDSPNLTGTLGDSFLGDDEERGVTDMNGIDAIDTAAAVSNSVDVGIVSTAVEVGGGGGGEKNEALIVEETDSLVSVEPSSVVPISGDGEEEKRVDSMEEEEPLTHDVLVSEVIVDVSLKAEETREEVVCGGKESSVEIESELGQNVEYDKEKIDANAMEEETTAQAASLEDLVSDIEIPDDKDVASVAGFTEIPSQDKGLDADSVLNSGSEAVEEEPSKEMQIGEDGDGKEDVNVTELKKTEEEEEKVDAFTVLEIEAKPQVAADVVNEVSEKNEAPVGESSASMEAVMDDVKEGVEKDPEAMHVPEATEEVEADVKYGAEIEKEGDGIGAVGEAGQTGDLDESRELSEELAKGDKTKIDEVSEETETMIKDEDSEKVDDMTDLSEAVETHGDSTVAVTEEGRQDDEEMETTEFTETKEETVMTKVDETKVAEMSEETETGIENEDKEEKDEDMTDVAEDVEKDGVSSVADTVEERDNSEEMETTELTETQEESAKAETGDEEPDEVEEENKSARGKRKRVKGAGKKKEEDVCFMCFDGGDLVLCDRR